MRHHAPPVGAGSEAWDAGQRTTHRVHLYLSHERVHHRVGINLHDIVRPIALPLQERQFGHLGAIIGIEQHGLGRLSGFHSRHDRRILVLPAIKNRHGIAVTLALGSRQGVTGPIAHAIDIACLTMEVTVLHPIGDGIDDIPHIGDAVPRERAVAIVQIGHRGIGLTGFEPRGSGIERNSRIEAVLEPRAQLAHPAINHLFLVAPSAVTEVNHAWITPCGHCLTHDMTLLDKLVQRPALLVGNPLADIDMTVETCSHLAPPCGHTRKGARGLPIDLWSQEIDRSAREPCHRVAVNLVILPVGAGAGLHTILVGDSL